MRRRGKSLIESLLGEICFYERYGQTKDHSLQGAVLRRIEKLNIKGRKLSENIRSLIDKLVARGGKIDDAENNCTHTCL